MGDGVYLAPSTLDGAGLGLFAGKAFPRLALVTRFDGELIDRDEALRRREAGRDSHIRTLSLMSTYIDGRFPAPQEETMAGRGGASMVNDGAPNGVANNTQFVKRGDAVYLQATRDVAKGEELLVSYGRGYWRLRETT